ncbi:MAG TPA: RDD family protein [Vitreimonas sp.]|nr:RDD family protein [Vitreimonas sp.]
MAAEKTVVQEIAEDMGTGDALLRRWLGCWIDLLALAVLFIAPMLPFAFIPQFSDLPMSTYMPASLTLCLLYFPVTEGFWGRTVGKLITGLQVVDRHGHKPGIGRALLRTLLRLFEVNPVLFGGVPAGIAVMCTKRKQRLGDLVADTYVIDVSTLKQRIDVDATISATRGGAPA